MQRTLPIISVNGVIDAQVSPLDRGFAYGDGVFETCKMQDAKIPLWTLHKERLLKSCEKLLIPVALDLIETQLTNLLSALTTTETENAVVKITVTRGQGGRGYRLPDFAMPTIVIGIFPAALYPSIFYSEGVAVKICNQRLSCSPSLAGLKHLNRLEQILARAEWQDESIAEGIVFDTKGNLIEAVFSNIFLIRNSELFTPDLSEAGVAGVMRRFIIETIAPRASLNTQIKPLNISDLMNADAAFLCNSLYGIWPVRQLLCENLLTFPPHVVTTKLQKLLKEELAAQLS
jgi:4-amino-4-deoxychorismate lyase